MPQVIVLSDINNQQVSIDLHTVIQYDSLVVGLLAKEVYYAHFLKDYAHALVKMYVSHYLDTGT